MADQSKIHVMDAWINYSKFYTRISKAMNYLLLEQHQLGLNDFYFLYFLSEANNNELQQSELQSLVQLSPSALSRMVTRLLDYKGLTIIKKNALEHDKRGYAIQLTETGEELVKQLLAALETKLETSLKASDMKHIYSLSME